MVSNPIQPVPQPETSTVPQLPNHKVKVKMNLQRSCNEKDEKGKLCAGHLKRWFYTSDILEQECGDVEKAYGRDGRDLSLRVLQDAIPARILKIRRMDPCRDEARFRRRT